MMKKSKKDSKQHKVSRKNKKGSKKYTKQKGGAAAAAATKRPREDKISGIIDEFMKGNQDTISNQDIIRSLKSAYESVVFDYTINPAERYEPKVVSKLDLLRFLQAHKTDGMLPWLNKILLEYERDIINGTNLEQIDNIFSFKLSTFFQNYDSFGTMYVPEESDDMKTKRDAYNKLIKKKDVTDLERAKYIGLFGEYCSIPLNEIMIKEMRHTYQISYRHTDKREGLITINTKTPLKPAALDDLVKKIIANILFYLYAFPEQLKDKTLPHVMIYFTGKLKELPPQGNFRSVKDNYIYPTPKPGGLPLKKPSENATLITGHHSNTALTAFGTILIFREEEMLKVLLHECMHYFKIINCNSTIPESIDFEYSMKSPRHDITETFIESLATIFNVIIVSPLESESIQKNLEEEMEFIFAQAAKILRYTGYLKWDDYYKPEFKDTPIVNPVNLYETTNIHCYYILRTMIFWYLTKFASIINLADPFAGKDKCKMIKEVILEPMKTNTEYIEYLNECIKKEPLTNMSLRMTKFG